MSTLMRKVIFVMQLVVVIFTALILSYNSQYDLGTQGFFTILIACIGARHMVTIGRSWGWGLFAVTGLGALIILFLPPKPVLTSPGKGQIAP